eukprot:7737860-Ditylum_brightwellii.AAC.1
MQNAKKHQYLNEDQHRSRNGREAQDIVLGKTLTFETLHFQRANFGCTDCDTKACYNRIIPLILILVYFKAGLPYQCCFFLATILDNLRYVLATAFGEAPYVNWHMFIVAVFGIGQGATDGPAVWLFISNVILKCYSWLAHRCKIFGPSKDNHILADADMFVVDNTLMHNSPHFDISADELTKQIQADAELWGCLLWVTDGLLAFLKSSYLIVVWSFTDE